MFHICLGFPRLSPLFFPVQRWQDYRGALIHTFMHIFYPKEIPEETTQTCGGVIRGCTPRAPRLATAKQRSCLHAAIRVRSGLLSSSPGSHRLLSCSLSGGQRRLKQSGKPGIPACWEASGKPGDLLVRSCSHRLAAAIPTAGNAPGYAAWKGVSGESWAKGGTKNHRVQFRNELTSSLLPSALLKITSVDFKNIFYKTEYFNVMARNCGLSIWVSIQFDEMVKDEGNWLKKILSYLHTQDLL